MKFTILVKHLKNFASMKSISFYHTLNMLALFHLCSVPNVQVFLIVRAHIVFNEKNGAFWAPFSCFFERSSKALPRATASIVIFNSI